MALTYDSLLQQINGLSPIDRTNPMNGVFGDGAYDLYDVPGVGRVVRDQATGALQVFDGSRAPGATNAGFNYTQYGLGNTSESKVSQDGGGFLNSLGDAVATAAPVGLAALAGGAFGLFDPSMFGATGLGDAGWTSGYDLAMGPDLMSMTGAGAGAASGASAIGSSASGAGDLASNSALSMPEYANESAKLLAQAPGTTSGILDTTLPTLSTGGGMFDFLPSSVTDFLGSKAGSTIVGGLLGGLNGSHQTGNQTVTTQQQIDPRMAAILYGSNGNNGFLSNITGAMNTPQDSALAAFGNRSNVWLGNNGQQSLDNMYAASNALMNGGVGTPTMNAAQVGNVPGMQAAQVNAPSQNDLNLSPAYQDMVYGQAGNNPYLTGAIQKGINQSNNAFGNMLTDATRNLNENILPGIRGGAIVNGAMGGSRQGIAEGRALNDFSTQMGRAILQFGQNNTDAAVSAQAGAYDADRNRALSAMSGLGAQQYGVASQNASMQQQANQTNYQGALQTALQNASMQQQANADNLQSQLSTNQLNTNRNVAGLTANSGLLNNAYGYGTNQDSYGLNKLGKTSGLLAPYTGLGGSTATNTPLYENTTGNILGGGLLGANIYNMLNKTNSNS